MTPDEEQEDQRALAAYKWVNGATQKAIAAELGYKNSTPVCVVIALFIENWMPEKIMPGWRNGLDEYGDDRRVLAKEALRRWADAKVVHQQIAAIGQKKKPFKGYS